MEKYISQIPAAPEGGFRLPGTLGQPGQYSGATATGDRLASVISTIVGVMTAIAFIWFVFLLFSGAIQYLFSGGDKSAVEAAVGKIRTALIGLVVVISAIFFIQLLSTILGIPILNISKVFTDLAVPGVPTRAP
jgi:hypothetical protein